ncbi:MAG: VWA domain-containing protein [Clostridia bacterium]|nr:VWA domain-containing protein [Clostridia bacterium]
MKRKYFTFLMVIFMLFVFTGCELMEPVYQPGTVTKENAVEITDKLGISVQTSKPVKGTIPEFAADNANAAEPVFMYELPSISNYPLDVEGKGEVNIEVFVPLENNGSSIREFVSYAAEMFNTAGLTVGDPAKTVSVSVRSLEASLAEEYILNGVYYPKGYVAANELYGVLMQENGIEVSLMQPKTAGNTMGVVTSKAKYDELCAKYGEMTIATLIKANEDGAISIGYTNPTNNPTGLNFVISMLSYFDANNPMSMEATTDFSNFQNTVSAVSFSTTQMKQAVLDGAIDAFVLEHQAFESDESLKNDFVFMPFGVRHDNPLYAVGTLTDEEMAVLKLFGEYFENDAVKAHAAQLGFGKNAEYVSTVKNYSGAMISTILDFWKEEKSSGKQIVAVFVADRSGSMSSRGKLDALKESLKNAMQYVGEQHKVGLISYSGTVYIDLPISEFTTEQQEYYVGAIDSWSANGGTATNNALLIALKLLHEEQQANPNIKPIVFLLSDGHTESGYSLSSTKEIMDAYDIPIYTIGYEANIDELKKIAEINQGAFINATSDDVGYILKTLFDAEI